ncbi:nucleoside/nucleotide kinase family protein [Fundidesulfovibrio butyratiphilus]
MIKQKIDVDEPDKVAVHSPERDSQGFGPQEANLYFVGLPGSGRKTLAGLAAERLGRQRAEADSPQALAEVAGKRGLCVAVTGVDLTDAAVKTLLRDTGKVFSLLSVAPILAKRLGDLSRLEELRQECAAMEPHLMEVAHFITAIDATLDEMVEDVAEKARL